MMRSGVSGRAEALTRSSPRAFMKRNRAAPVMIVGPSERHSSTICRAPRMIWRLVWKPSQTVAVSSFVICKPIGPEPRPWDGDMQPHGGLPTHQLESLECRNDVADTTPGQNCAKNNILCGGYEVKKPWRKGARSKNSGMFLMLVDYPDCETGRPNKASMVPELPQIISAMDNPLDSQLFSYFTTHAGQTLNIYSETHNPFDGFVIDMAIANTGLMHSLLCLSASCLLAHQQSPSREIILRHSRHHFDRAVVTLRKGVEAYSSDSSTSNGDCIMLQTMLLAQEAIVTGEIHGSYRCHLLAAQRLAESCEDLSMDVQSFARQFLQYHNLANTISCLDPVNVVKSSMQGCQTETAEQRGFSEGCVDGILQGLLDPISRARQVRDAIRYHRGIGNSRWFKDEQLLSLALGVETQLRTWQSRLQPNTPQYWSSLACRQSAYVYLYRTIKPSEASAELAQVVSEGLSYTSLALRVVTRSNGMHSWVRGVMLPPLLLLGCACFDVSQR